MKRNFVVAVTGASGSPYALRLIAVLLNAGCDVQLTISAAAVTVLQQETGRSIDLDHFDPASLGLTESELSTDPKLKHLRQLAGIASDSSGVLDFGSGELGTIRYHHYLDLTAGIASGSFRTDGMVICPCSLGTLSAIVHGLATNLVHRAAEVHLKERRRLVLVPRETPLSLVQLDNLRRAAEAGATVLPAMPGFYHGVRCVEDLIDFVVSRICDQLDVANELIRRWGTDSIER